MVRNESAGTTAFVWELQSAVWSLNPALGIASVDTWESLLPIAGPDIHGSRSVGAKSGIRLGLGGANG